MVYYGGCVVLLIIPRRAGNNSRVRCVVAVNTFVDCVTGSSISGVLLMLTVSLLCVLSAVLSLPVIHVPVLLPVLFALTMLLLLFMSTLLCRCPVVTCNTYHVNNNTHHAYAH